MKADTFRFINTSYQYDVPVLYKAVLIILPDPN